MSDISMCANGEGCSVRNNCYRYKAKPCREQSWADFNNNKGADCERYWPMEVTTNV